MKALFCGGAVVLTPGVQAWLWENPSLPKDLMARHEACDWAELMAEDQEANRRALANGSRILSRYTVLGQKVWVITEAVNAAGVRTFTTILFPTEY